MFLFRPTSSLGALFGAPIHHLFNMPDRDDGRRRHQVSQNAVVILGRVLISHGCHGALVPGPAHQLSDACAGRLGPGEPGVPKVVEPEVLPGDGGSGAISSVAEGRIGVRKHEGVHVGVHVGVEVGLEQREDVGRDSQRALPGLGLRGLGHHGAVHHRRAGLGDDKARSHDVHIPPAQPQDLAASELAPRREEDSDPEAFGDGVGESLHLGNRSRRALGRSLGGRSLHHARGPRNHLVADGDLQNP